MLQCGAGDLLDRKQWRDYAVDLTVAHRSHLTNYDGHIHYFRRASMAHPWVLFRQHSVIPLRHL